MGRRRPAASPASRCCRRRRSGARASTSPGASPASSATCSRPRSRCSTPPPRAVAACDEDAADNPLRAATVAEGTAPARIFGSSPGIYGAGIEDLLSSGDWESRDEIGRAYLDAASHAYGGAEGEGARAPGAFAERIAAADLLVHTGDDPGRDILEGSADVAFVGGFSAAMALLGRNADVIVLDTTDPARPRPRSVTEAVTRVVRARAANPRFIAGQMRHGPRGASEFAETVDRLVGFAETTGAMPGTLIEAVHDAYLGDEDVRAFILRENPAAAIAIAERLASARAARPVAPAAQFHRRRSRRPDRRGARPGAGGMNALVRPAAGHRVFAARRLPGALRADAHRRRAARAAQPALGRPAARHADRTSANWPIMHGNGIVEVTARGSFQIRGLTDVSAGALAREVDALGIAVRTGVPVQTAPLAGLDLSECADPRPLAAAIRAGIDARGLNDRLGPKVSVVIDGGGHSALASVAGDVRLTAIDRATWQVAIGGDAAGATPIDAFGEIEAGEAALALLIAIADRGMAARGRDLVGVDLAPRPPAARPYPEHPPLSCRPSPPQGGRLSSLSSTLPLSGLTWRTPSR